MNHIFLVITLVFHNYTPQDMTLSSVLIRFTAVVTGTVLIHWILVNSYVYFCAPPTLFGAFKTFLSLGSPVCHTINMFQFELAKHYVTIWTGAGIAAIAWGINVLQIPNENPK